MCMKSEFEGWQHMDVSVAVKLDEMAKGGSVSRAGWTGG